MFDTLNDVFAKAESKVSKFNKTQNLNDFLQEVLKILIDHYPGQAYEKLEEVAYLLKADKLGDPQNPIEFSGYYQSGIYCLMPVRRLAR